MPIMETDNFKLGIYAQGDNDADKVALVLPGLLDTKDYLHMKSHVEYLADLGYMAASFDMPGIWESGDDITEYSITNSLKAISELIQHYARPTLVVGHSNGGRLALLASLQNPEVDACVAIMCAPTFVRASNYHERKVTWKEEGVKVSFRDLPDKPHLSRQFNLPYSFCEDADKYDSRDGLEGLTIPKLFIAGKHDTTVTPEDVKKSFDVAAEPKQFVEIDSDHDYRKNPSTIDIVNGIIGRFIQSSSLLR